MPNRKGMLHMKRYLIGIFFLTIALSLFIGCSKSDDPVIADIGGYKLTTSEFDSYFDRVNTTFPTAEDEFNKRKEILDTMIVTRLLIQAAYEKGIDKMDEIDRIILANKDKFLLDELYQTIIAEKTTPTDVELQEFYNNLEFKYRASHILVEDKDTAQMIFEKLQQGENFEKLAFEYSIDPQAKRNKGDLGYFVWGSMIEEFQQRVVQMEPGEIAPPFKSKFGYHIVKLIDKQPNENRTSFALSKEEIRSKVTQTKTRGVLEVFYNGIKEKYPVTIDTSTCEYLAHKRSKMYPAQILKTLPFNDFDIEQLDRNEKELVIATIKDAGQVTLGEYLTELQNVPQQFRPNLNDYDSLATIIFEIKKLDILAIEAVKLGVDNDKNYIDQLKLFKELNMAGIMRSDSLLPEIKPDETMARTYYEEHPEEFTNPEQIHIYEILLNDEIKARQLASKINSLEEFKEKAMDLTERTGKRAAAGDLGYITRKNYPEIFDLAKKTNIGEIGGPVVTLGKYSIFYVIDKIAPELKDYLGVKKPILEKLIAQQKQIAFDKWVADRMANTKIDIDEDALRASINMDLYVTANSSDK